MKAKYFAVYITAMMISSMASAQTIKQNIEKAHADKDAKTKSAKADVLIMPKTISDSAMKTLPAGKTVNKKKVYKKKRKTSTK